MSTKRTRDTGTDDDLLLERAELTGADFSGRRPASIGIVESRLVRCDFSDVRTKSGSLGAGRGTSEYIGCMFDRCWFAHVNAGRARFVGCSFREVRISKFFALQAEFIDCVFSGILREAVFSAVPAGTGTEGLGRDVNEFHGNDFRDARLIGIDFRYGIDLGRQRLPEGPEYVYIRNVPAAVIRARTEMRRWRHEDHRREAHIMLGMLEAAAQRGQHDAFLRKEELVKDPEAAERLAQALTQPGDARP